MPPTDHATSTGITAVTRGPRDLAFPSDMPAGASWPYGMGVPMQLGPRVAAISVNIRHDTAPVDDLEVGSDLVIFDQVEDPSRWNVVPLSRMEFRDHPRIGQKLRTSKCPFFGGFVPLGALRADGSPHPHAGTGFGLSTVIGYPFDHSASWVGEIKDPVVYFEEQQYAFDGETFRILDTRRAELGEWVPGWVIQGTGLSNAVASGNDLLTGMVARREGGGAAGNIAGINVTANIEASYAGVARWARDHGRWRMTKFVPVTPPDASMEPSLVRGGDGNLYCTTRACYPWRVPPGQEDHSGGVRVWRSRDEGATWERTLASGGIRPPTPVGIAAAVDGSMYVVMNSTRFTGATLDNAGAAREFLELRPLSSDGRMLGEPLLVRDAPADFGPAPAKRWCFDHPIGATLRLGDGRWRHLLIYRGMDLGESAGADPTPATGLYVEEVMSRGAPASLPWRLE
ncbi:MAG: sialidase family protein [Planctomycetota bacterium]|nr:sialidase family protein [Planctomycetota bacterium]